MSNIGSPSPHSKYTQPHLRYILTSPLSEQGKDIKSAHSSPSGCMDIDNIHNQLKRKLSLGGNRLWADILEDDTLPAPLPDLPQDVLQELIHPRHSGQYQNPQEKNQYLHSNTPFVNYNKENQAPNQTIRRDYYAMTDDAPEEHQAVTTQSRALAVARHNALILNNAKENLNQSSNRQNQVKPQTEEGKTTALALGKALKHPNTTKSIPEGTCTKQVNAQCSASTGVKTNINRPPPAAKQLFGQEGKEGNTTYTKDNVELEPQANYAENLINQLKRMNLKPPICLNGQKYYKKSEELEAQGEKAPQLEVIMDDEVTENYIQDLVDTALIFYFSSNVKQFRAFTDWAEWAFEQKQGWRIEHIKYLGKNFFVVKFERARDKKLAKSEAPWYMNRRFMYTFPWRPSFNVHMEFLIQAPVWIELQFRDLIFEPQRRRLVEQLGPILYYNQGMDHISP
jgi:hypothetical protein